jgi:hypothetical protein
MWELHDRIDAEVVSRRELKKPPTAVGGIASAGGVGSRRDLKKPPTAVGGINSRVPRWELKKRELPLVYSASG